MRQILFSFLVIGYFASASAQQPPQGGPNGQPGMQQPGGPNGQPGMQQPGGPNGQPGMQQPGGPNGQPGMQQSGGPNGQPGMQQPGGPNGQPGMQQPGNQMPGMKQPGNQMPGMQQPGNQMPGMQQPGGPNGQPSKPVQPWPADKCEKEITKAKKAAENCLKIKTADKRSACYNEIGQKLPQGFEEGCRAQVEPVKMEIMNKEKQTYPNQPSSFNQGGNGGPQGQQGGPGMQPGMPQQGGTQGQTGGPGMQPANNVKPASPAECSKFEGKIKAEADKCLKLKTADKRKPCFDKIGEMIGKENIGGKCPDMINSVKATYQGKEAQMYPKDPPSIQ